jgi:malonyl-CoA/methylmalonyl-CoA synthetase
VNGSYYALLSQCFAAGGQRLAITAGTRALRYAELEGAVARMACGLVALGARPGDRIAAQVERSPEALCLYLACLYAGFVYLPLNPALTAVEVAYYLADAAPRIVVLDPARALPDGTGASATVVTLDAAGGGSLLERADSAPTRAEPHPCTADDVALLLYTSGTTGKPKGAMLTHGNLASNTQALCALWHFNADDVLLHVLPLSHVHGLVVALGCAWLGGATVRLLERFDPAQVAHAFAGATAFMGVPTHYARLLAESALDEDSCATMRLFVSGSAPLAGNIFDEFEGRTGHRILERYGMTETLMIASNPYEDSKRVRGSVGFALPEVELRAVDRAGAALPRGDDGVLEVRGPNVCKGYWQAPEKTAQAFHDGWLVTGDIGRVGPDGRVWLEGRSSDLIISGGYNVYPREVEDALLAVKGVSDAAVFGVPHPQWGEAVVAALCLHAGAPREDAIVAALRTRLAGYKLPKHIVVLDALPRNAMGKVQKERLRAEHAQLFS